MGATIASKKPAGDDQHNAMDAKQTSPPCPNASHDHAELRPCSPRDQDLTLNQPETVGTDMSSFNGYSKFVGEDSEVSTSDSARTQQLVQHPSDSGKAISNGYTIQRTADDFGDSGCCSPLLRCCSVYFLCTSIGDCCGVCCGCLAGFSGG